MMVVVGSDEGEGHLGEVEGGGHGAVFKYVRWQLRFDVSESGRNGMILGKTGTLVSKADVSKSEDPSRGRGG